MLTDDILTAPIPIGDRPLWGEIRGAGLGIEVDPGKLNQHHQSFVDHGHFLPWAEQA